MREPRRSTGIQPPGRHAGPPKKTWHKPYDARGVDQRIAIRVEPWTRRSGPASRLPELMRKLDPICSSQGGSTGVARSELIAELEIARREWARVNAAVQSLFDEVEHWVLGVGDD